jgi:putative transposase
MPRQPRFVLPGHPLHVIQRGNDRSQIFLNESDYHVFRDCFAEACHDFECLVHAYVLMSNHVHFLMTPKTAGGIGLVMQAVGRRYVKYFNRRHERTGGLWEGRYRATLIDSDRYLLTCYRYIEMNPVRAGLVEHPGRYRWSSYAANALAHPDILVSTHDRYLALGQTREARLSAYRALFRQALDGRTLQAIRDATNKSWVLGHLPTELSSLLNRHAHPRRPGRPAKKK